MKVRYTVPSEVSRVAYVGNGTTTVFSIPFNFYDDTDIYVVVVTDATQAEAVKTLTTHYTITGGDGSTGSLTMLTAPASGYTLVIERNMPYTQEIDLEPNDPFPAEVTEEGFDRTTMLAQQASLRAKQAPKLPASYDPDVSDPIALPLPETGKVLVGNTLETGWENLDLDDVLSLTVPTVITSAVLHDQLIYNGSSWINKPASPVNVKWYGAVGDGVTDDTAAFSACFTAQAGKSVYIPAGTYPVKDVRVLTGTTVIADKYAVLTNSDTSDATSANLIVALNGDNITWRGGKLVGTISSVFGTVPKPYYLMQVYDTANTTGRPSNITIEDLWCVGGRYGIYIYGISSLTMRRIVVEDVYDQGIGFVATGGAGGPYSKDVLLDDIRTERCGLGEGIKVASLYQATVASPTLTTTAGSTSATISSATGVLRGMQIISDTVARGTYITNISGTTITLSSAATITKVGASATLCWFPITNVKLNNLTIRDCGRLDPTSANWQEGLDLFVNACEYISVTDFHITGCGNGGIELKRSQPTNAGAINLDIMKNINIAHGYIRCDYDTTTGVACNWSSTDLSANLIKQISIEDVTFETLQPDAVSTTVTTTSASTTATLASAAGVVQGMSVTSTNIPDGAAVVGIDGTTITLSIAATATAVGTSITLGQTYTTSTQGVSSSAYTDLVISNCRFYGSFAKALVTSANGGSSDSTQRRLIVRDCTVYGAWYGWIGSTGVLENCQFLNNSFWTKYDCLTPGSGLTSGAGLLVDGGHYEVIAGNARYPFNIGKGITGVIIRNATLKSDNYCFVASLGTGKLHNCDLISAGTDACNISGGTWDIFKNHVSILSTTRLYVTTGGTIKAWMNDRGSDTGAPTIAATVGEVVMHSAPASAGNMGWVCTTAGGSGVATWKAFGTIA